jgi:hypothetical protein
MGSRRAAERQRDILAFDADGDFVLCSCERKTYPLVARQKRAFRQFPENCRKFVWRELAIAVMLLRQFLACRQKSDGPRALAADLLQHGVIVARADAEIPGDEFAFALFGQDSAEETPTFIAREALFPQGQGLRQRRGAAFAQPALRIVEDHLVALILNEPAGEFVVEVDIDRSRHALLFLCRGRRSERDLDSQSVQDRKRFSDLASFLAFFEVNYEALPGSRSQSEGFLRHAEFLARVADEPADLLGRIFQRASG